MAGEYDELFSRVEKLYKDNKNITSSCRKACSELDIEYNDAVRRNMSKRLDTKGVSSNPKIIEESSEFKEAKKRRLDKRRKTFLITWAQNSTPVHKGFFDNLIAYKDHLKAGLHIVAGRYRNGNSVYSDKEGETWVKEVLPYLDANRHHIHKHLEILSDIKISPTASMPLSGLNGVSGLESCILGHPRVHLKSLPVLNNYPVKLLMTTGACTVPNYTDSKAGAKGVFNHNLGAVIVELDGENFHIRQITADKDGNFYDLHSKVENGEVSPNTEGCEVAVLGDLHIRQMDKEAEEATFKLLDKMKPNHTVIHDIFDGNSISHHNKRDPFLLLDLEERGLDNVEEEISEMFEWIEKRKSYNLVIPAANHNDWLDQWLNTTDWRKERNKKAYLKYANVKAEGLCKKGMVAYLIDKEFGGEVTTLDYNGSYRVLDWELALHYDKGANGSRGSATQFKNLNTKSVGGHGHSAFRYDGSLAVGTLTKMDMGYNKGMSTWTKSNVLIYPNGKAQHIHYINGKFHR